MLKIFSAYTIDNKVSCILLKLSIDDFIIDEYINLNLIQNAKQMKKNVLFLLQYTYKSHSKYGDKRHKIKFFLNLKEALLFLKISNIKHFFKNLNYNSYIENIQHELKQVSRYCLLILCPFNIYSRELIKNIEECGFIINSQKAIIPKIIFDNFKVSPYIIHEVVKKPGFRDFTNWDTLWNDLSGENSHFCHWKYGIFVFKKTINNKTVYSMNCF